MSRFRVTVTEISTPVETAPGVTTETEVFKLVIDEFEAVAFTKAIAAKPRRRRNATRPTAS